MPHALNSTHCISLLQLAMLLIVLMLFVAPASSNNSGSVFLEEPGNGEVFVPVNSSQTLTCSVIENHIISWTFQEDPDPGSPTFPISNPAILANVQRMFQIDLTEISPSMSVVTLNVTEELNETRLTCLAVGEFNEEREALLIIYGPPSSPTNLMVNVNSSSLLNISWSASTLIPEVPVNFTLTITNLDTSETTSQVVMEENYIFDAGSRRCTLETYEIEVVAVNPAGSSLPVEVSVTLPPVLDLSSAIDSLKYSLTRESPGNVLLNVSFQNDNPSLVNYTLILQEVLDEFGANATSDDNEPNISNSLVAFLVDLVADTKYQFFIEATSEFGNCSLGSTEIVTTDVQSTSLCQLNETTFSVMCIFLTGSLARGCVYTLVSARNNERVTGRVERGNSSEGAADLSAYDKVILMDWESDGINGTTPVRLDLNFTTCPTVFSSSLPPSSGSEALNIAAVVVPVVLVIIITSALLIVIIAVVYTRVQSAEQEESTAAPRGETDVVYDEIGGVHLENQVTCEDNPAYGTALQL